MQTLYIKEQNDDLQLPQVEKQLTDLIEDTYHLYLYLLLFIEQVAEQSTVHATTQSEKLLEENKKKFISTKINENPIVQFIREDEAIQKAIKKAKLKYLLDEKLIEKTYKQLIETPEYRDYINNESNDWKSHHKIISYLLNPLLADNEDFDDHLEAFLPNWQDDAEMVINYVLKNSSKSSGRIFDASFSWKEEETFAQELLNTTIKNESEYKKLIQEKAKNWEVDRITVLDIILMQMAVCEFLEFPFIPTKVTMNEYIELSKFYSTPKSKEFINGIIDKLRIQLVEEGKIKKTGRGLVE